MNHSAECTCEESLCETLRAFSAQHPESVLYQTSLMSALLSGVYEGSTTIADLLKHGDFGLGTFNELDGELIAFSSQVYQLRADGSARKAQPEQKTPFAVMTWFQPQYRKTFDHPVSRQQPVLRPAHRRPFPPCPYPYRTAPDAAVPGDDRRPRRSAGVPL